MENQNNFLVSWGWFLLVTLTTVLYTLPSVKMMVPYVIMGGCMLLSLLPVFIHRDLFIRHFSFQLLSISLYFLIAYYLFCSFTLVDSLNEAIRVLRTFIPVFWGIMFMQVLDKSKQKMSFFIIGFCILYILFITLKALHENPMISRLLAESTATSDSFLNQYRMQNVGGFEFSYMIGLCTLCVFWKFLVSHKFLEKILCLFFVVLFYHYIILTQYATLLLLTSLGILGLIYGNLKTIYTKLLFIVGILFLLFFGFSLLVLLQDVFQDSLLSMKFEQISTSIVSGDVNDLGGRPLLMFSALNNWISSPIFGGNYENLNAHSLITTILVQTGLVGLLLWLFLYCRSYKIIKYYYAKIPYALNLVGNSFVYLFLLSFFNPIGYAFELPIACFFIVPLFINVFNKEKIQ